MFAKTGQTWGTQAIKLIASLELKPQRELPDAVAAGVTNTGGENLSECAVGARISRLSQVVARIIEVYVVGEIGKAALELQPKPLREPEILGEPQGEVNCSGANKRPRGGVAKAANHVVR